MAEGFRVLENGDSRISEADEFRVTEGYLWDGPRVTEASDPRITEADVFRVTEKFIEGESSFTGSGSLSTVGQATLKAYWDNGSEAFFIVTPLKRMYGIAPLNGAGTLTNDGVLTMPVSSSFTGTASISSDCIVAKFGFGAFNAAGSLNVIPKATFTGSCSMAATASKLSENIGKFTGATHNFDGVASISVTGNIVAYRSSNLNATGSIVIDPTLLAKGLSNLTGTGSLASTGLKTMYGATSLSASGSLAAIPVPKFFATFNKTGTGTLAADGTETDFSSTMYYRTAGVWKETIPYVKRSGTWSTPVAVYKNISGSWKRVY